LFSTNVIVAVAAAVALIVAGWALCSLGAPGIALAFLFAACIFVWAAGVLPTGEAFAQILVTTWATTLFGVVALGAIWSCWAGGAVACAVSLALVASAVAGMIFGLKTPVRR
jgi:hypothetical protein